MKTRSSRLSPLVEKSTIYSKDLSRAISKNVWPTRIGYNYWLSFLMLIFQSMSGRLKSPASLYIHRVLNCLRKSIYYVNYRLRYSSSDIFGGL